MRSRDPAGAAAVNSHLRRAGIDGGSRRALVGPLWLPSDEAGDPVAVAVADHFHGVQLRGEVWRSPIDPAVLRDVAGEGLLRRGGICLLVWQRAIMPRPERIVFTTTRFCPGADRRSPTATSTSPRRIPSTSG